MQVSVSHTDKFDLRIYTHMLETQETRVQSLGQENPMEEKMTTTPVFLPGKFHKVVRQARHKESDMTEHSAYTYTCSRSLQLCEEPGRLFCPWDSADKNTEDGCHFLLQGIIPTQVQGHISAPPGKPHIHTHTLLFM